MSDFVEAHGLRDAVQREAAREVLERAAREGLSLIRLAFPDQHGVLRGKAVTARGAASGAVRRRLPHLHSAVEGHLAPYRGAGLLRGWGYRAARCPGRGGFPAGAGPVHLPRAALGAGHGLDALRRALAGRAGGALCHARPLPSRAGGAGRGGFRPGDWTGGGVPPHPAARPEARARGRRPARHAARSGSADPGLPVP